MSYNRYNEMMSSVNNYNKQNMMMQLTDQKNHLKTDKKHYHSQSNYNPNFQNGYGYSNNHSQNYSHNHSYNNNSFNTPYYGNNINNRNNQNTIPFSQNYNHNNIDKKRLYDQLRQDRYSKNGYHSLHNQPRASLFPPVNSYRTPHPQASHLHPFINENTKKKFYSQKSLHDNKRSNVSQIKNKNNPTQSLDIFQRQLNDMLLYQRQKKRMERQKHFKKEILIPEINKTKKKYDREKQMLKTELEKLKKIVDIQKKREQIQEEAIKKWQRLLPTLQKHQPQQNSPVMFLPSNYQQPQIQKAKPKRNLKRLFRVAVFCVIFSRFFPKYVINFNRNKIQFWKQKILQKRYSQYKNFLDPNNVNKIISALNIYQICRSSYSSVYQKFQNTILSKRKENQLNSSIEGKPFKKTKGRTPTKYVSKRNTEKQQDDDEDYQNRKSSNKLKKSRVPTKYVKHKKNITKQRSKSKSKKSKKNSQPEPQSYYQPQDEYQDPQPQNSEIQNKKMEYVVQFDLSSKFISQLLNKLAFLIEKQEIFNSFYQNMALTFLDRSFIPDQALIIQELVSLDFHHEKGYAKFDQSKSKFLLAFNVFVKIIFSNLIMNMKGQQSRVQIQIMRLAKSQAEGQFFVNQIGMNSMLLFAIFGDVYQNQIRKTGSNPGNFIRLPSSLQALPSPPLIIIDNHLKQSYDGRNENDQLYRDIEQIICNIPGAQELKELILANDANLLQQCQNLMKKMVNFLYQKILEAKKQQYRQIKQMTFNDFESKKFDKQYDSSIFEIRDVIKIQENGIIDEYLSTWGKKAALQGKLLSQLAVNKLLGLKKQNQKNILGKILKNQPSNQKQKNNKEKRNSNDDDIFTPHSEIFKNLTSTQNKNKNKNKKKKQRQKQSSLDYLNSNSQIKQDQKEYCQQQSQQNVQNQEEVSGAQQQSYQQTQNDQPNSQNQFFNSQFDQDRVQSSSDSNSKEGKKRKKNNDKNKEKNKNSKKNKDKQKSKQKYKQNIQRDKQKQPNKKKSQKNNKDEKNQQKSKEDKKSNFKKQKKYSKQDLKQQNKPKQDEQNKDQSLISKMLNFF